MTQFSPTERPSELFNQNMQEETVIDVVPASVGARVVAYLLNSLFGVLVLLLAFAPLLLAFAPWGLLESDDQSSILLGVNILWSVLLLGGYAVLQIWWMSRDGQSIGKKLLNIRVLTLDGRNPGFVSIVLVREIAYELAVTIVGMLIGYVVMVVWGGDASLVSDMASAVSTMATFICFVMLFVASSGRRTLQDYLAGTIVVKLPPRK